MFVFVWIWFRLLIQFYSTLCPRFTMFSFLSKFSMCTNCVFTYGLLRAWIWILCFHRWQRTFHFFLLKLKRIEAKVKCWSGTHMTQLFLKNSWFLQNFRRERTVFHFIFKKNGKSEAVFQHLWSARRQFSLNVVWLRYDHFFYCKTENISFFYWNWKF